MSRRIGQVHSPDTSARNERLKITERTLRVMSDALGGKISAAKKSGGYVE